MMVSRTGKAHIRRPRISPHVSRVQAKLNMMFSGTTLSGGGAVGVVTATGMRTEIGKIQANVQVGRAQLFRAIIPRNSLRNYSAQFSNPSDGRRPKPWVTLHTPFHI